jgi:hypothetical protein
LNYILRAKILPKTKIYGVKPKLIKNKKSSITLLIIIEMLYLREYCIYRGKELFSKTFDALPWLSDVATLVSYFGINCPSVKKTDCLRYLTFVHAQSYGKKDTCQKAKNSCALTFIWCVSKPEESSFYALNLKNKKVCFFSSKKF